MQADTLGTVHVSSIPDLGGETATFLITNQRLILVQSLISGHGLDVIYYIFTEGRT